MPGPAARTPPARLCSKTGDAHGFVRECHGDLHLGNIALVDGDVTLFDRLEFNESMRWIDVMNDVAFVVADLQERKRPDLAARFLTGVSRGDRRLRRARRVAVLSGLPRDGAGQGRALSDAPTGVTGRAREATGGVPGIRGSGTAAHSTAAGRDHHHPRSGRLRQDDLRGTRDRADGRASAFAPTSSASDCTVSEPARPAARASERDSTPLKRRVGRTRMCCALARTVVEAGYVAVVDGAFLKRWQRDMFREAAAALGVPFVILAVSAAEATLRDRIARRRQRGGDASEATLEVLDAQLRADEPLDADEQPFVVPWDTSDARTCSRYPRRLSSKHCSTAHEPLGCAPFERWSLCHDAQTDVSPACSSPAPLRPGRLRRRHRHRTQSLLAPSMEWTRHLSILLRVVSRARWQGRWSGRAGAARHGRPTSRGSRSATRERSQPHGSRRL